MIDKTMITTTIRATKIPSPISPPTLLSYLLISAMHKQHFLIAISSVLRQNKKAVLPQGNRAMPQVFFSVKVRQQHSLQV